MTLKTVAIAALFGLFSCYAAAVHRGRGRVLNEGTGGEKKSENLLPTGQAKSQEVQLQIDPITRKLTIVKMAVHETVEEHVEHVYTLDIGDLRRLEEYTRNLRQHINSHIFNELEVAEGANRLDLASLIYHNLPAIRRNWELERLKVIEKATYLKKITEYALSYCQNATNADLSRVISERNVDIDAYNKFILIQLIEKLDAEVGELERAVSKDLSALFDEFDANTDRPTGSAYTTVNKNIEISFRLTVFKTNQLGHRIDTILAICRKITDNEKYHHIAQRTTNRVLLWSDSWSAVWAFALLLLTT